MASRNGVYLPVNYMFSILSGRDGSGGILCGEPQVARENLRHCPGGLQCSICLERPALEHMLGMPLEHEHKAWMPRTGKLDSCDEGHLALRAIKKHRDVACLRELTSPSSNPHPVSVLSWRCLPPGGRCRRVRRQHIA